MRFDVAEYDKDEDIVIDPYRLWATYYGGNLHDEGYDICTDNFGNIYVTGCTASKDFPLKVLEGAYNDTMTGQYHNTQVYILKFNSNGERLWATYYGGGQGDFGFSMCTDNSYILYVTGYTTGGYGLKFPLQELPGAYNQDGVAGERDAFILKFSPTPAGGHW